jgi:hypothetical protein
VKVGGTTASPNALIEPSGVVRTQLIRTAATSNDPTISHVRIAPYDAAGTGDAVVHVGVDRKVGIGTISPQNAFVVSNAGAEGLEVVPSAGGSPEVIAFNRAGGPGSYIPLTLNGSAQVLKTSGTERVRITSDGKVGIGTSSPQAVLDIAVTDGKIQFHSAASAGTTGTRILSVNPGNTASAPLEISSDNILFTNSGNLEAVRVVNGKVGIGTSTPTATLTVKGNANITTTPVYADNTAALAGGLVAGDIYRKADGSLMITF